MDEEADGILKVDVGVCQLAVLALVLIHRAHILQKLRVVLHLLEDEQRKLILGEGLTLRCGNLNIACEVGVELIAVILLEYLLRLVVEALEVVECNPLLRARVGHIDGIALLVEDMAYGGTHRCVTLAHE